MTLQNQGRIPVNSDVRVDCYVRGESVSGGIEAQLERLRALSKQGLIDELDVHVWPKEIVASPITKGAEVFERFRTFNHWANQWAVRLEPAFRFETRHSKLTGETHDVLVTPSLCLAVSIDGRLREVFPHETKGTTYTVEDGIEALQSRTRTEDTRQPAPVGSEQCPQCDTQLLSGQGLYFCIGCEWGPSIVEDGAYGWYWPESRAISGSEEPPSSELLS